MPNRQAQGGSGAQPASLTGSVYFHKRATQRIFIGASLTRPGLHPSAPSRADSSFISLVQPLPRQLLAACSVLLTGDRGTLVS